MPDTARQQACPACNGTGQLEVTLQNTATGAETAIIQMCLGCLS